MNQTARPPRRGRTRRVLASVAAVAMAAAFGLVAPPAALAATATPPPGTISTIAGSLGGPTGDGAGAAIGIQQSPDALAVGSNGVYIADATQNAVRLLSSTGGETAVLGDGGPGETVDVPAPTAQDGFLTGVAADSAGVFSANVDGTVDFVPSTSCGSGSEPACPFDVSAMTAGKVYNLLGTISTPYSSSPIPPADQQSSAQSLALAAPAQLAVDSAGDLLIAGGSQLGSPGTGSNEVYLVAASSCGSGGESECQLNQLTMTAGGVYPLVGGGTTLPSASGVAASSVELNNPQDIAVGPQGDLLISNPGPLPEYSSTTNPNQVLLFATTSCPNATTACPYGLSTMTSGYVYLLAGAAQTAAGASPPTSTSGTSAADALLAAPTGLAVDSAGDVLITNSEQQSNSTTYWGSDVVLLSNSTCTYTTGGTPCAFGLATSTSPGDVYLVAGGGGSTPTPSGVPATSPLAGGSAALLLSPTAVALDSAGNALIADESGMVSLLAATTCPRSCPDGLSSTTEGEVYQVAGLGPFAHAGDGGPAASAELAGPTDVAADPAGNVLIADTANLVVRMIAGATCGSGSQAACPYGLPSATAGDIYTVVGNGQYGPPTSGAAATSQSIKSPRQITTDPAGDLVLAEGTEVDIVPSSPCGATGEPSCPFGLQSATPGNIYPLAGANDFSGSSSLEVPTQTTNSTGGVPGADAELETGGTALGVAVDPRGDILVSAATPSGSSAQIFLIAAKSCSGSCPYGLGALTPGNVYLLAGDTSSGAPAPSTAGSSAFTVALEPTPNSTLQLATDPAGDLLAADGAGSSGPGVGEVLLIPYVGCASSCRYVASGVSSTTAGDAYRVAGSTSPSSATQPATSVELPQLVGVAVDAAGNLLLSDGMQVQLVAVSSCATGCYGLSSTTPDYIYPVAGNGLVGWSGDGGPATAAELYTPAGLGFDTLTGDLLISDTDAERIRAVTGGPLFPVVTGVSPTAGPTTGGTPVTISGKYFSGATAVDFGTAAATNVRVVSATEITATSPGGSAGTVAVTVTTTGGKSATSSSDTFTYVAPPTVSGVSPTGGYTTGGTPVKITGTNFSGATTVDFGTAAAKSYTVTSATSISAVSPAGSAGSVDVTVTTAGGTSATSSSDHFTYTTPPPTVSAVSPTDGSTTGGTPVTITGTNFSGATAVDFGTTAATNVRVVSATEITATDPAGSAGSVDVTVTTAGGTSATSSSDTFTYYAPPTVTGLSPATGYTTGGTPVTITGTNFTGETAVHFGTAAATNVSVVSSTEITADSPSVSSAGPVAVTVTTPGGTSSSTATSANTFTYTISPAAPVTTPAPSVTGVSPTSGPTAGGTSVTITGTNFTGATTVDFGDTAATGFTVVSATQITADSPAEAAGPVAVTVTTPNGTSATSSSDTFTFTAPAGYTPTSPTRIVDTSTGLGGVSGDLSSGTVYTFSLGGSTGSSRARTRTTGAGTPAPAQPAAVPAGAAAVLLNVTAILPRGDGNLRVYPAGAALPGTSTVNYLPGEDTANFAIVALGANDSISVYSDGSPAGVALDVLGYLTSSSGYSPTGPTRILDTRSGLGGPTGPLTADHAYPIDVGAHVPAGTTAVAINVTAVDPSSFGNLRVYPSSSSTPDTSTINYLPGVDTANFVILPLPANGILDVYSDHANVNVLFDLVGTFSAQSLFSGVTPTRILDTRAGSGLTQGLPDPLVANTPYSIAVHDAPVGASAVVVNVTAISPDSYGNLRFYPGGQPVPTTSTINYLPGVDTANLAIVPLGTSDTISLYSENASVNVAVDVLGYLG